MRGRSPVSSQPSKFHGVLGECDDKLASPECLNVNLSLKLIGILFTWSQKHEIRTSLVPEIRTSKLFEIRTYRSRSATVLFNRFLVRVSYLEIYNEEVRDILRKSSASAPKLEIRERADVGVYVKDLQSFVVKNADEMDKLMTIGNKNSMCTPHKKKF